MKDMTSSGLLASIYEWDDNTIDIIFIDEHNAVTSENGLSINDGAGVGVSFVCRRPEN